MPTYRILWAIPQKCDTDLQALGVSAVSSAAVVTVNSVSLNVTNVRVAPNTNGTELVTLNPPVNGIETSIIGGTITIGDGLTITVYDPALPGGSKAVPYTVVGGDTTSVIATKMANLITADTNLAAVGVSATASANVISLKSVSTNLTSYDQSVTGSPTPTETITLSPSLGVRQFSYNNVNQLVGISAGGATTFSGTTNKAIKSATVNGAAATLPTSISFTGNATLANGANNVPVSATDGSNVVKTNNYQIGTKGQASSTLTFDANGNMTSNGTDLYSWDALNRLIQITYPGSGNNTKFTYDGLSGLVKIVETTAGSITTTRQFVRCGSEICEERDAGGTLVKQFFSNGQTMSASNYFYNVDMLGSVRDITDSSGGVQARYDYDMWGLPTKTFGTLSSDFGFAGYFVHARSGLNLNTYRAYSGQLGRWINRDPIEENGGANLYEYVNNSPINGTDPLGLFKNAEECCKAKADLQKSFKKLKERYAEQAAGRTEPKIVQGHAKAIVQATPAVVDALRRWALYCRDDDPPPPEVAAFLKNPTGNPKPTENGTQAKVVPPPILIPPPILTPQGAQALWTVFRILVGVAAAAL